jgi:hypothetical protein
MHNCSQYLEVISYFGVKDNKSFAFCGTEVVYVFH